jgi:hypothetical protein
MVASAGFPRDFRGIIVTSGSERSNRLAVGDNWLLWGELDVTSTQLLFYDIPSIPRVLTIMRFKTEAK